MLRLMLLRLGLFLGLAAAVFAVPLAHTPHVEELIVSEHDLAAWELIAQDLLLHGRASNTTNSSRCVEESKEGVESVACSHEEISILERSVLFQIPLGTPPAAGWPSVIMFQGSFFSAKLTWAANSLFPFGGYQQTLIVKSLLDSGFAVLTPKAMLNGAAFWDTNIPPFDYAWDIAPDKPYIADILKDIASGTFGHLDIGHVHAAGISSGGYMTSRMAVSYAGHFRSLTIESASYATCGGPLCPLPKSLPSDHPPTLFLHGAKDIVVPISTMEAYNTLLQGQGIETKVVVDPDAMHRWIKVSVSAVPEWIIAHNA